GILKGSRLDDVVTLTVNTLEFTPAPAQGSAALGNDALLMAIKPTAAGGSASPEVTSLKQGETPKAKVTLRDGRVYTVNVAVTAPRPIVELLGKSVQPSAKGNE